MKEINEIQVVPSSRLKREFTSLLRRGETVAVSHNGDILSVFCPNGSVEFDVVHKALQEEEKE